MEELENKKHEALCMAFMKDLNATNAYMEVYPESSRDAARKNVPRLMSLDVIKNRIAQLMNERNKRVQVTIDDILKELLDITRMCLKKTEIEVESGEVDNDGNPIMVKESMYRDKKIVGHGLKSVELVGKHIGMWRETKGKDEALETIESFINRLK